MINVSFSPTAIGNSTGTLTITDSAAGSPQTVSLTGAGVAASIGLVYAPNNPSSSSTPAGSAALTTIQVGGAGVGGTVNFTCSGLPQGASCSFSPSSVQAKANVSSQVQLSISTTARTSLLVPVGFTLGLSIFVILLGLNYLSGISTRVAHRLRWRLVPLFALMICACGGSMNSPSGGSSSSTGTPAGTSTVVITATSGTATQTLNFMLGVK